jgi:hypothetical protein
VQSQKPREERRLTLVGGAGKTAATADGADLVGDAPFELDPELKMFIDDVVVPALIERLVRNDASEVEVSKAA